MDKVRPHIITVSVLLFAAILIAIFLFRANPPANSPRIDQPVRQFTYGNFIDQPFRVPKGELVAYKFDLNRKATLKGKFSTIDYKPRLTVFVVTPADLEAMKSNLDFASITTTGEVPGGLITRNFEPGSYYVVFDNRKGLEDIGIQEALFSIE